MSVRRRLIVLFAKTFQTIININFGNSMMIIIIAYDTDIILKTISSCNLLKTDLDSLSERSYTDVLHLSSMEGVLYIQHYNKICFKFM